MPTAAVPTHPIAHLLFADTPIDGKERDTLGISTFLKFNDREGAVRRLNSAMSNPGNEARMRLTAAATLRAWGEPVVTNEPMLGAVVEYPMERGGGVDYVAAYADGSARYLNYTGSGIIWDTPRAVPQVDAALIAFLNSALMMLPHAEPMDRWSPAIASPRITCLTLTGNRAFTPPSHPGPQEVVRPFNACINAAVGLMSQLIECSRKQR